MYDIEVGSIWIVKEDYIGVINKGDILVKVLHVGPEKVQVIAVTDFGFTALAPITYTKELFYKYCRRLDK